MVCHQDHSVVLEKGLDATARTDQPPDALVCPGDRGQRRLRAKAVGVVPMRKAKRSGLRWASLEDMLDEPAVVEALGAGLATSFRRLYLDPFGPNYRNELAHGATDPAENHAASALLTALAILSVALRLGTVRQHAAADAEGPTTAPD